VGSTPTWATRITKDHAPAELVAGSPGCQPGDGGFDSRRGRSICPDRTVRQPAERRGPNPRDCGFESRPCDSMRSMVRPWMRASRCSSGTHNPGPLGSTPRPAMPRRRVGKPAKPPARDAGDCGFDSHLGDSRSRPVVQRPGRLSYKQDGAGSSPAGTTRGVRMMGGWSNGKTPALQAGDRGSTPRPVHWKRKVAGYGSPGLVANQCARKGMRVRIPRLPLGDGDPDGETEIIPRFERGVPGSSPGRGMTSSATEGPPDRRRDPPGTRASEQPCGFESRPFRFEAMSVVMVSVV
jgi:hypothetical protein